MQPSDTKDTPVVIFCGGRGTRLKEETEIIPKPLVKVGEQPILWHIMKIFHSYGFKKFILLVGYKGDLIKQYCFNYPIHASDFTVRFKDGRREVQCHEMPNEDWEITVIDTGLNAETAARLKRAEKYLAGKKFLLTYGDGVANVNLNDLTAFHDAHPSLVTVTGVNPPGRFGEIRTQGAYAQAFWEKRNRVDQGYINGGFIVVEPEIFKYIGDDPMLSFEKHILPRVASEGKMTVFPHSGYWQCMDTMRDMEYLNDEWSKGNPAWKIWK